MQLPDVSKVDSQELLGNILQTADFAQPDQKRLMDKLESAIYVRSLKTLLALLPEEQKRKLETTMHFQPHFFLERVLSILQAFSTPEQIVEILNKSSEETFLEFFDTFLTECSEEQKKKINEYLKSV